MKNLHELDQYRIEFYGEMGDEGNGAFQIPLGKHTAFVIASNGLGWEHVSVSINNVERCPKWDEMCTIKDMFFNEDEVVMQLHPIKSDYVNIHNYCLHLWRPLIAEIPVPPKILV